MAKRRITHQQARRIADAQARKRARAEQALASVDSQTLGPEQPGRLIAHFGATALVESENRQEHQCAIRQNLPALVVGDEVIWQPGKGGVQGVISALSPRRSCLYRGTTDYLVAANVDQLLIVISPSPAPLPTTLDRYLVACEHFGLQAVIIRNKADLPSEDLAKSLAIYEGLGYRCVQTNTHDASGIAALVPLLQDKVSILVGQSGVGKSSLVNLLMAGVKEKTGELTKRGHGKHTTSVARLYHLASGGDLIDSPGVRKFQLTDLDRSAIAHGFVEFRDFLGQCHFRDCRHLAEPECALREAVARGEIHISRLEHFHRLVGDIE